MASEYIYPITATPTIKNDDTHFTSAANDWMLLQIPAGMA